MPAPFSPEQMTFFREHPAAENVRTLYFMAHCAPNDPGASALLQAAIEEAEKHPDFPCAEPTP